MRSAPALVSNSEIQLGLLQNWSNPNLYGMSESHSYTCTGPCGRADLPRNAFHEFKSPRRGRQVTSRCRECRREDYFKARYPDTICGSCMKHRPVENDGICRNCHEELGLRICNDEDCGKLLPSFLMFHGKSKVCKTCQKKRLTEKPAPDIKTT